MATFLQIVRLLKPVHWLILAIAGALGATGTLSIGQHLEEAAVKSWVRQAELDVAVATTSAQGWLAQSETLIAGLAAGLHGPEEISSGSFDNLVLQAEQWNSEFSLSAVAIARRVMRDERAAFERDQNAGLIHAVDPQMAVEANFDHMVVTFTTEQSGDLAPLVDLLTRPEMEIVATTARRVPDQAILGPAYFDANGNAQTLVGISIPDHETQLVLIGKVSVTDMIDDIMSTQVPEGINLRLSERDSDARENTAVRPIFGSLEPSDDTVHTFTNRLTRGQARWNYSWDVTEGYLGGIPTANATMVQIGGLILTILIVYTIGFVSVQKVIVGRAVDEKTADLVRQKEIAERTNRAKSEFLANLSHELRTPLNAIVGYSQALQAEMFGPIGTDKNREYVDAIHDSGTRLSGVIGDILDLSKIEAGQETLDEDLVNVADVIDECQQAIRGQLEEAGLSLKVEVEADLPALFADKLRVKQITLNLLSNAVKFTPAGGDIVLGAKRRRTDSAITIIVSDTGCGIAPEEMELVLEPFGQTGETYTRPHDGTGLGLPLVLSLLRLHGGDLKLQSEQGKGTVATAAFPPDRTRSA